MSNSLASFSIAPRFSCRGAATSMGMPHALAYWKYFLRSAGSLDFMSVLPPLTMVSPALLKSLSARASSAGVEA